jgi:histidinol-phosphate aminotransferase
MKIKPHSVKPITIPTPFAEFGAGPKDHVDLAGCENVGPSTRVMETIAREVANTPALVYDHWKAQDDNLREQLGELHGVPADQIFITAGALAGVDYSFKIFVDSDTEVALLRPDFPGFIHYANRERANVNWLESPNFPFQFSVADIADFVKRRDIGFTILSNPNAVTGTMKDPEEVKELINANPDTFHVIDEADTIMPDKSAAYLVNENSNAAFLGSFSKFYGLSGLRVGYVVSPKSMAEHFSRTISPIEVNSIGLLAAREVLGDKAYQAETQTRISRNLEALEKACAGTEYQVAPGSRCLASYLWSAGVDTAEALGERGLKIAQASTFGLDSGGRVNLGSSSDIGKLCYAIREIHSKE